MVKSNKSNLMFRNHFLTFESIFKKEYQPKGKKLSVVSLKFISGKYAFNILQ